MKSANRKKSRSVGNITNDRVVLTHIMKFGLTASSVWDCSEAFDGLDRIAIGHAVRRLAKAGVIKRGVLHHGKFYFVPTSEVCTIVGQRGVSFGLLGEPIKRFAFARLLIGCRERPSVVPALTSPLIKHCGESFRGIASRFLVKPSDCKYLGFLRIDSQLHSRPDRPAQQLRADLLRFAKQPLIATFMKQNSFEYLWTTVSTARANAVMEKFSSYKRVGRFPISVVVLPELMPLLAGITIQQETFQIEH
ncbi:MAG: hypothetical protein SGI77_04430 [Pirellulaceae bacterium]|nr:hypothetical protein [Pirellulaceae bacterium]